MEQYMKEYGLMTKCQAKVKRHFQMEISMMVNLKMMKQTDMEYLQELMEIFINQIGKIISYKVKGK